MKRILIYSLLFLASEGNMLMAQNIQGKVVDPFSKPIDGVAVVMQTKDSIYVDAVITDSLGLFRFNQPSDQVYQLLFQHLLYEPVLKEVQATNIGTVILSEKDYALDEVTIKAERPQVKAEGGILSYNIPQLMKNKTSLNAFEVIRLLPGITGTGDEIQLVGAGNLQIILNGQLTTMSLEQLIQLLKSIPASRVLKAEIMYNAPAKYNVKGSVINVILDQAAAGSTSLQGEAGIEYQQRHYASGKAHGNILYSNSQLSIDFLLKGGSGRDFSGENMVARHTLEDGVTEIKQIGRRSAHTNNGTMRLGFDYTFNNKDKLSMTYYLDANKSIINSHSNTSFTPITIDTTSLSHSIGRAEDPATIHNFHVQYDSHADLSAGIDFTHYKSRSNQAFLDMSDIGTKTDMLNEAKQNISRWQAFINHTKRWESGWSLNYGINGGYVYSKNDLDYRFDKGNGYELDKKSSENNVQKDYSGNVFAEVTKSFGEHFSATVALKGEFYKSDYHSNDKRETLWNDWNLFPTASLSYTFNAQHILQMNVNSDKTFPTYMTLSPQSTPINSYSEVVGNPLLKPYRSYIGQLMYIFRQKYMLMFYCDYEPDYFTQLPYQSDTELKNIFRYENMNYQLNVGFNLVVPFNVGNFWDSRVTLSGFRMQERSDHFHQMSFNREAYVGVASISNTFNLSNQPDIKLTIDGNYVTPGAIQGIYDLESFYNIAAGLKWTFANGKGNLIFNADDIFRSGIPNATIAQGNQWSKLHKLNDERCFSVSFVWKFGGFKKKKHENVDTSRFGI